MSTPVIYICDTSDLHFKLSRIFLLIICLHVFSSLFLLDFLAVALLNNMKSPILSSLRFYFTDHNEDKMLVDGLTRFCDDLKLDPVSFEVLLICWKFKASVQGEFLRKEFVDGMCDIG